MAESTRERQYKSTDRGQRRVLTGTVIPNKMSKTISVMIERMEMHRKYKKYIRRHHKYHVHDENNEAHSGDSVELMECRPLSKFKRWRLVRVVERAALPVGQEGGGQ